MAGQGTVGLEIIEQVPDVDAVLVPVGGGGLLAGVATAIKHLKPNVLIYVSLLFQQTYFYTAISLHATCMPPIMSAQETVKTLAGE